MKLIYLKSALKCDSFDVAIDIKIPFFLEFWLLLSRVAPYYSSLPRTVWLQVMMWNEDFSCGSDQNKTKFTILVIWLVVRKQKKKLKKDAEKQHFIKWKTD